MVTAAVPGTGEVDDEELVARVRSGDREAFAEIVRRHQRRALRIAWVICQSTEEAQDAVQDAFVKAHRGLDGFRDGASLTPWLMRIVANEARNRRRSTFRWRRTQLRDLATTRFVDESTEPEALAGLDRRAVTGALARLNERDREVLGYRFLAGLSEGETAELLSCPIGTVKSRTSRALERLRAELGGAA